jgi:N-acetylmuramoyl-L-alanine amidase
MSEATPDLITDDLLLAALSRAVLHRSGRPAPRRVILEHLALRPRSKKARQVQARLQALLEAGSLERSRAHGMEYWALTPKGRRRLRRVRHVAGLLPESPQHLQWRSTRTAAAEAVGGIRASLRASLSEAMRALDAPSTSSDDWLALRHKLERDAHRLATVTHCLYEWPEPDDCRADAGRPRRAL